MISVYNETQVPWKMEKLEGSENVTRFVKRKVLPDRKVEDGGIQSQSISILAYTAIISDIKKTANLIRGAVSTIGSVTNLSDANTAIIFNKKAFRPFITENEDKIKDVLIASINLKGKKVVALDNNETFLLEYFIFSGELSFIASFNCPNAILTITLLEEDSRKLTTYTFKALGGESPEISITIKENETLPEDQAYELARIRKFRPSRATHTIVVQHEDRELLESVIGINNHNIVEVTKDTQSAVIAGLQADNYRAITLFVNYGYEESQLVHLAKKYFGLKKDLPREFKTVFILHNDGRIYKLKF